MEPGMARLGDIVAGLEEMRLRGNASLWLDPNNHWCVTFEARDSTTKGPPFWLQVQAGMMNMQYLDEDEPIRRLIEEVASFPQDVTLIAWDSARYATFDVPQQFSSEMAALIDRIMREYYALQPDYEMSYSVEDCSAYGRALMVAPKATRGFRSSRKAGSP
jgi:hypothetical protein